MLKGHIINELIDERRVKRSIYTPMLVLQSLR